MDTENKPTLEKDDFSLPKSIEVEEIIDFYKDKDNDLDETENQSEEIIETKSKHSLFFFLKRKTKTDDDIQSSVYGLSEKGRIYLYRAISAFISVCIIVGSFVLAYFLPGNADIIKEQENILRSEKGYVSLKSRHSALKTEVSTLKETNEEKKTTIEQISDIDNTKAELRTEIETKKYELSELNTQITEKRGIVEALDASIAEKASPETVLPPGRYSVGTNIAAGKYNVTGTGKFMVATSAGKSKINTTLGSTPLPVTLDDNDVLKFDGKVKFTSAN